MKVEAKKDIVYDDIFVSKGSVGLVLSVSRHVDRIDAAGKKAKINDWHYLVKFDKTPEIICSFSEVYEL